jgi:phosphoenolpyruvate carboxylase
MKNNMSPQNLDPALRELVNKTVATLGEVIQQYVGKKLYNQIEAYRKEMTLVRVGSFQSKVDRLEKVYTKLKKLSNEEQFYVAHSFALMLEIMNVCENAYRTHIIHRRKPILHKKHPTGVFYVLTAHPTESRSPQNVEVFTEMQSLLVNILDSYFVWNKESLKSIIEKAWHTPITRQRKPEVRDEAEYLYSIVLNPIILNSLLRASTEVSPLYIRSWVGGDKDGHPGVNSETMIMSLNMSRTKITTYLIGLFNVIQSDLQLLKHELFLTHCRKIIRSLRALQKINNNDGKKINQLRIHIEKFISTYVKTYGSRLQSMIQVDLLIKMFPGLVVPLELRESSDLVTLASQSKKLYPISAMLNKLQKISTGGNPRWYVRGFIISMCGSIEHVDDGLCLVKRFFKEPKLPVIPLFEQEAALQLSSNIVSQMLENSFIKKGIKNYWHNRLEIMLGYSDSAKEVGVLQSRLLISETVKKIELLCSKNKVVPVFFHGSGGSVDRGGGSVQEQTSWLSNKSRELFKATIQGEMVERTFSSPSIFRSGFDQLVEQISNETSTRSPNHSSQIKTNLKFDNKASPVLNDFAANVSQHYKKAIHSPEFLEVVQKATPYKYLSALKMGSRPSKRGKISNVLNLRAIPWVLCWTQTRTLFPVWWGIGSSWNDLKEKDKAKLKIEFKKNPLFRSYVKLLGFTLAKVELPIWEIYLKKSGLSQAKADHMAILFQKEFQSSILFLQELTGQQNLLWYRPWLGESIHLRSPMLHPLNLLQIISIEKNDPIMIRETVAGIANGMMTTG